MDSGESKSSYQVNIISSARRDLKRLEKVLDRQQLVRIDEAILALSEDPRPHGCEFIEGAKGILRVRVGTYRILYSIDDDRRIVSVARIRHRRDVYRN